MKRFKNDNWEVCEVKGKRCELQLPHSTRVYMIVIHKRGAYRRRIVYVGSSKSLFGRIYTHNVLQKMVKNLKGYKIEIWHKDFGSREENLYKEYLMIYKIKPPFNLSCNSVKLPNKIYDFWVSVGVSHLMGRYRKMLPIDYFLKPNI